MQDYLKPVRTFIRNLELWGFEFKLSATGMLIVNVPEHISVSPVLEEEIRKRAMLIVRILEQTEPACYNGDDQGNP